MCLLSNRAWNCYVTSSLCSLKQGLYHFVGPSFPTYKMIMLDALKGQIYNVQIGLGKKERASTCLRRRGGRFLGVRTPWQLPEDA